MKTKFLISLILGLFLSNIIQAQFNLTSAGQVGIGITTPENSEGWDRVLHVYGSNNSKTLVTTSNIQTGLWSHNSGIYGSPAGGITGTLTNHPFSIITNQSMKLTILSNGNVGIGTSTPENVDGWMKVLDIHGGSSSKAIVSTDNIYTGIWSHEQGMYGAPVGGITGTTSNHPFSIITNKVTRMVILSNGNVGIGTSAPVAPLHVNGNTFINGNLGIGTSSPIKALHVNGDVYIPGNNNGASYWINSTGVGMRLRMLVNTNYGAFIDFYPYLWFRTGATGGTNLNPLYIQSSTGYVGMNTTNPQYQLDVNGVIRANNVSVTSDARLKQNVKNLNNPIDSLSLLQGVTYKLKWPVVSKTNTPKLMISSKPDTFKSTTDTIGKNLYSIAIDSSLYNRRHIGFIAQDLQKIYPDLVYKDKNGILSVDYISIIPILVEAFKQQQVFISAQSIKIKELDNRLSKLETPATKGGLKSANITTDPLSTQNTTSTANAFLYQNIPNPFSISTEISYYLPDGVQNASILIFDMQGSLLKTYILSGTGKGSITINSSQLKPGMYLYTLIADDKEIDTKRMILTE